MLILNWLYGISEKFKAKHVSWTWKPIVSIQVVLRWTQAVKLYKNFFHFKYSLRVNKKNILAGYSLLFKSSTLNYLHLSWVNIIENVFVSKRPVNVEPYNSVGDWKRQSLSSPRWHRSPKKSTAKSYLSNWHSQSPRNHQTLFIQLIYSWEQLQNTRPYLKVLNRSVSGAS